MRRALAVVTTAGLVPLALAAGVGARGKPLPPNLTGQWYTSATAPAWQLHSSANRKQLTATWGNVAPHQNEVSHFSGKLNAAHTAYVGTVHNTEGSVKSTGTLVLRIVSAGQLSGTYRQDNGFHSTITLTRKKPQAPGSPFIAVSSSGAGQASPPDNAGPGSTTYYYGGTKNGTTNCGGAAMNPHSQLCTLNQAVNVQGDATITAAVSQPLASGQQLVIIYDSGNGSDPEFQHCLSGYNTGLGCVIAASSGQSVQVQIPIPSSKSAYGGVHYLSMIGEAYPATQPSAELDLALCEPGASPECG